MTLPAALAPLASDPSHAALLVDFDGSLAPIVEDPSRALALPAARDALGALVGRLGLVAVVSGRPVSFLVDALRLDGLVLVGQYGVERLERGRVVVDERASRASAAVERAAREAEERWPGLHVERKHGLAVTLHWRRDAALAPPGADLDELARRHGLRAHPGRMACELRPAIPVDKGTATRDLLDGRARVAAFAGDDRGDLDAFAVLDELVAAGALVHAARIAVLSREAPPELVATSDVTVDGPPGLAACLVELRAALNG